MNIHEVNGKHESVQNFCELGKDAQELINAAIEARKFSYSPYSKFKVGAAIRVGDGSIISGCNVENAAYSPSICAERTAACKAISTGHSEFKAAAVVAFQQDSFTTPCGVCRQVLSEFAKEDIPIYVAKPSPVRVLVTSIKSLLPHSFVPLPTD
ncbi:cytidine deaminase-like [Sitodiplosis mosellana]|uniref:cytidine deaminase-like n=1 Tax=Sitodiplosis mosellana TaxID=263140 RepID=UPI0024447849|nr:cytidine deaminase-like [Sitodiplosis mosellana]XP_055302770.1 cytidine deaminase-like [Sitodiplosis mosellana]XP_055302771.1 cytidine deaminase-like [Sitodiplosis mosellana]XP_055302772.1 cytidine deaminase-like [Sitodiplosis mosellana]